MSSTPAAPRPVVAKRHPKPRYLAPGEHIKVASRKPPPKPGSFIGAGHPGGMPPRDPWESLDDTSDEPSFSSPHDYASQPHPHSQHVNADGVPSLSTTLSSSHKNSSDTFPLGADNGRGDLALVPRAMPSTDDLNADGCDSCERCASVTSTDSRTFGTTKGLPELSPAERAQRVLEAQHSALEAKQLEFLAQEGVARRPKTLVRNRHGRLNAMALQPPRGVNENVPQLLVSSGSVNTGSVHEKAQVRSFAPRGVPPAQQLPHGAEEALVGEFDASKFSSGEVSSPSTAPLRPTSVRLEIDMD